MGFLSSAARWLVGGDMREPTDAMDDFWYTPLARPTGAGIPVNSTIAIKASAVYSCVKILAETMASIDCYMKKIVTGGSVDAPNHPLEEIIRYQPNTRHTAVEFWEMMVFHAMLNGGGYAEIVPGPRGAVDQLLPIDFDHIVQEEMPDHTLRFRVSDSVTGRQRILLQEEVFRIPGLSSDGVKGLRAVDIAAEAIGLGIAADQYAARVFSNRLNMGGFLSHPSKLSPDAQKNLIDALMKRLAGPMNAHRPMVLQEGMKFTPASQNATEAQLLEARKWQVNEVARFWRIPLHMLGIYDGATYANVEEQSINFVKYTIAPIARRITLAIRRDLIVGKGTYFAHFDLDTLLRGDSDARSKYYSAALGAGGHLPWLTQNEVRMREGWNPDPSAGADELGLPANLLVPQKGGGQNQNDGSTDPNADPNKNDGGKGALLTDELASSAKKLIRKENAAIGKAQMRFADNPEAFRGWATAFYGGHVSTVTKLLGIDKKAARVYCDFHRDELLRANDVQGLLIRREEGRAKEIVATLRKHGAPNGQDGETAARAA